VKPLTLLAAVGAFVVGAVVTFAIVRGFGLGNPEIAFVVGAVLAVNVAAFVEHRAPKGRNSPASKAVLGGVLAACAVAFGLVVDRLYAPFAFADVSIGISAVGCFCFPFFLFNTIWKPLEKAADARRDGRDQPTGRR
jgi:hypothetical protein